jgi:ribose 5-phosphate isomerase B
MSELKIAIGSDHAGFELKTRIINRLKQSGFQVQDFGTDSTASMDYPDVAHPLAISVEKGENRLGILLCGSGNGVAITANKHSGIRAALCWLPELASLARQHNDANILVLPARFIDDQIAFDTVDSFLAASFEGGRHAGRVSKICL